MAKLLTSHEDARYNHFHALVGLLNLIQYIFRYVLLFGFGDMNVGFGRDLSSDLFFLCCMTLPNVTSFIFNKHVPQANKGDNVTIWKEYRLHNAFYVMQSILFLGLKIYELHFGLLAYVTYYKIAIIALRFYCMWASTHYYPPGKSSTIRGAYKDAPEALRFFLSYVQFASTSVLLLWEIDTIIHFVGVSGLQINSFAMTLRKKNKLGTAPYLAIYVFLICTVVGFGFLPKFLIQAPTGFTDERLKPFYMGLLTYMVRRQGINRFATWIIGPALTESIWRTMIESKAEVW